MAGSVRGRGAEAQGQGRGLDSTRTRRCHYYRLRFSHWLWLWLCVNFIIMVFLSFFLFLFSTFSPFLLFSSSTAVAACTKVSISNVALTYDGLPRIVIDQLEFLNWFQFRSRIWPALGPLSFDSPRERIIHSKSDCIFCHLCPLSQSLDTAASAPAPAVLLQQAGKILLT